MAAEAGGAGGITPPAGRASNHKSAAIKAAAIREDLPKRRSMRENLGANPAISTAFFTPLILVKEGGRQGFYKEEDREALRPPVEIEGEQ